eukprot:Clim_evm1s234 gene=Clim_evmTU1s234
MGKQAQKARPGRQAFRNEVAKVSSSPENETDLKSSIGNFLNQLKHDKDTEVATSHRGAKGGKPKLLLLDGRWYEIDVPVLDGKVPEDFNVVHEVRAKAEQLMETEIATFENYQRVVQGHDYEWMQSVIKSGTSGDKIAAMAVQVQESPFHRLNFLDALTNQVAKGKRRAIDVLETLKELWITHLLPDRKLTPLSKQKLVTEKSLPDKVLLIWAFEDALKVRYSNFLRTLSNISKDPLDLVRSKVVKVLYELLVSKPEQEHTVLNALVNKLGDSDGRISSLCTHNLLRVIQMHPGMKSIVFASVCEFLARTGISERSQYNAMAFLNQVMLSKDDTLLARSMVTLYLSVFSTLMKKGGVEEKMMAALLTGMRRAFPFTEGASELFADKLDSLYQIVYKGPWNSAVQALSLLFMTMESSSELSDRYFKALYFILGDLRLLESAKPGVALNLILRSISADTDKERVAANSKRLFQMCCNCMNNSMVCALLLLLGKIGGEKDAFRVMLSKGENHDDDEEHFGDADRKEENHGSAERKDHEEDESAALYQPEKQNPRYVGALSTAMWEAVPMARHWHPSAKEFMAQIMRMEVPTYPADPLEDFTFSKFLERFVLKKAKKVKGRTGSAMQRETFLGDIIAEIGNEQPADVAFHKHFYDITKGLQKSKTDVEDKNKELDIFDEDQGNPSGQYHSDDDDDGFDYADMEDMSDLDEDEEGIDFEAIARMESDDEDDENGGASGGGTLADAVFADADEYTNLLDADEDEHRRIWERSQKSKRSSRSDAGQAASKKRKGGPGGRSGKRHGSKKRAK